MCFCCTPLVGLLLAHLVAALSAVVLCFGLVATCTSHTQSSASPFACIPFARTPNAAYAVCMSPSYQRSLLSCLAFQQQFLNLSATDPKQVRALKKCASVALLLAVWCLHTWWLHLVLLCFALAWLQLAQVIHSHLHHLLLAFPLLAFPLLAAAFACPHFDAVVQAVTFCADCVTPANGTPWWQSHLQTQSLPLTHHTSKRFSLLAPHCLVLLLN